jgi:uncharacterized repeat protein (TIGR03803 family)
VQAAGIYPIRPQLRPNKLLHPVNRSFPPSRYFLSILMNGFVVNLLAAFAASALHAAPAFDVLADFQRTGIIPTGRLLAHPDGNYYGTTVLGGAFDYGTIFKMTPSGTITVLASFTGGTSGAYPGAGLELGPGGELFGTTQNGGTGDLGTIFKVSTSGTFTQLASFTGTTGQVKGSVPNGVVFHSDGFFYGSTQAGGQHDLGTIFKFTPTGTLTTITEFTGTTGSAKGSMPSGRVTLDGPMIYGTTQSGGENDLGTVFAVNASGSVSTLVQFSGTAGSQRGASPLGGVTLIGNALFGTTETGGTLDLGTVFKKNLTGANSFTILRDFAGPDGAFPSAALLFTGDSFLYGTTSTGGDEDLGVVFKIAQTPPSQNSFVRLANFTGDGGAAPGAGPRSALIVGHDGTLYGTTEAGGASDTGTAFKISTLGVFSPVATMTTANGWEPAGSPFAVDGGIFAPLKRGGTFGHGTVLRIPTTGSPSIEFTFDSSTESPAGPLSPALGALYGLSTHGGLYRLETSLSPIHITNPGSQIGEHAKRLHPAPDGSFIGTTPEGGAFGKGCVFRISPEGLKSILASFSGPDGEEPAAELTLGEDGRYFGTTESGGLHDEGTIYAVTLSGTITTLHHFSEDGPHEPTHGVVFGADGALYGTASEGGAADKGAVFRFSDSGVFSTISSFTGTSGAFPGSAPGPMIAALDGTLYGVTRGGGTANLGTIFKIPLSGTPSTLFTFTGNGGAIRGQSPANALVFGPGGALFGVASSGGTGGGGTAFRVRNTGPHIATGTPVFLAALDSLALDAKVQLTGETTNVFFDYGSSPAFGQTTAVALVSPGSTEFQNAFALIPAPTAGQTTFIRARAVNASGTSVGATLSFTRPTAASQWKIDSLGDANAPDLGDPDGDGVSNILEYALVLSPTAPSTLPSPGIQTFAEGPRLTISVTRDPARSDVTIEVRAAPSPEGPWVTVASSTGGAPFTGQGYVSGEIAGDSPRTVLIKDSAAAPSDKSRYLQIRVIH